MKTKKLSIESNLDSETLRGLKMQLVKLLVEKSLGENVSQEVSETKEKIRKAYQEV